MSGPSLDGPILRARVAHEDIVALQNAIDARLKIDPPTIRLAQIDYNDPNRHGVHCDKVGASEPRWGIAIGEILHNLRAALDGIAWQVALKTTDSPDERNTMFPIYDKDNSANRRSIKRNLESVDSKYHSLFQDQQPYKLGGQSDSLWLLNELNAIDKHRVIHLTAGWFGGFTVKGGSTGIAMYTAPGIDPSKGMALSDGAQLANIVVTPASDGNCDCQFTIHTQVCFGAGPAIGLQVLPLLVAIHARVERIIKDFSPLFP